MISYAVACVRTCTVYHGLAYIKQNKQKMKNVIIIIEILVLQHDIRSTRALVTLSVFNARTLTRSCIRPTGRSYTINICSTSTSITYDMTYPVQCYARATQDI